MRSPHQMVRQGDVLLVPIAEAPAGKQVKAIDNRLILARGEATGHHHSTAENSNVSLLQVPSQEDLCLLVKEGDALLEHQEHAPVTVGPGAYRVVIQREYSPAEIRRVAD